jgi:predicted deacylase
VAFLSLTFLIGLFGCQLESSTTANSTTTNTEPPASTTTTTYTTAMITSTFSVTTETTTVATTETTTEMTTTEPITVVNSETVYLAGQPEEFSVYKFETNVPGPTFLIIGGIHGNERAGWMAALAMLDYDFTRGTVYILPVANKQAAYADPPVRYLSGWTDLNRSFPGNSQGTATQRLALTIFNAMVVCEPDIVLDLHESRYGYDNGGLGNSLILHLGSYSLYIMSVIDQFNSLPLMEGEVPFTNLNSPPAGSINKEFTESFSVPVITIETNRDALQYSIESEQIPLSLRISQQLAMIDIILKTFGNP